MPHQSNSKSTESNILLTSRNLNIDILRAIAILLVLGRHIQVCPLETNALLHGITQIWQDIGWIGVDLFFVLSGFLVSTILFKEMQVRDQFSIRRFLIRRGFKIYPPFYFLIAFTVLLKIFLFNQPVYWENLVGELLFLQNYLGNLWGYTWSLAVEEHFYLLLPLLLRFLAKRSQRLSLKPLSELPWTVVVVMVTCLILRLVTSQLLEEPGSYSDYAILFATHLRLDSLMVGVLISWLFFFGPLQNDLRSKYCSIKYQNIYFGIGISLVICPFLFGLNQSAQMVTIGLTVLSLGFSLVLVGVLFRKTPKTRFLKLIASIGQSSYSIYLWHGPVNLWFIPLLADYYSAEIEFNWYIYAGTYLLGSISLGWLMTHLLEIPVLRLRDYYFASGVTQANPKL